jgi:hypothetical protein
MQSQNGKSVVRRPILQPASLRDEAVIVAFRKHTLLPMDDCLYSSSDNPASDMLVAKLNPIKAASEISDQAPHAAKHRFLFESGRRAPSIQVTLLCEIFGVTNRVVLRTLACRRKGGQFEIEGPI